jgi:hypothetical protein
MWPPKNWYFEIALSFQNHELWYWTQKMAFFFLAGSPWAVCDLISLPQPPVCALGSEPAWDSSNLWWFLRNRTARPDIYRHVKPCPFHSARRNCRHRDIRLLYFSIFPSHSQRGITMCIHRTMLSDSPTNVWAVQNVFTQYFLCQSSDWSKVFNTMWFWVHSALGIFMEIVPPFRDKCIFSVLNSNITSRVSVY